MSYILDTLKKLDKEKSEFENKINLKELIVKDDSEVHDLRLIKRRNYLLTLLVFIFALFFVQNFYRVNYSNVTLSPQSAIKTFEENNLSKANMGNTLNEDAGHSTVAKKTESPSNKKIEEEAIAPEAANSQLKKEVKATTGSASAKKENLANSIAEKVVMRESPPQDIRDLKVNGIIYFGKDNPLNYALASYKGKDQVKLKPGDRLNEVEILEIHSEKILFIYRNKLFEKKLGS